MASRMMVCCVLVSSLALSCGRKQSEQLLQKYGQREYAHFSSPIVPDSHSVAGLELWKIKPLKSVEHRCFVVGTDKNGDIVESPAIFLRLYKPDMTARQAAQLSIEIMNDDYDERHALEPQPHTMVGDSGPVRKWIEPPHFADGNVVYWTNDNRCYEASTSLSTGDLTRTVFGCRNAEAGDFNAGGAAATQP